MARHFSARAGLPLLDIVRLGVELTEYAGRRRGLACLRHCRELIRLGADALRQERLSVTFSKAMRAALEERAGRRPRTRNEFRSICERMLRCSPGLAQRKVRNISAEDCRELLERCFPTLRQRAKGRVILHGLFAFCQRQQWCSANPVAALRPPSVQECEVRPLGIAALRRLLDCAQRAEHRACMPALGLMLWAGIRPAEVERIAWQDIDWQEKVIALRPRHSKTGGARHVTLHPVLAAWLREAGLHPSGPLCPRGWARRWRLLRGQAGLSCWQQDALRHSFASYHVKKWHDFPQLQLEMGHRSAELLRTRYLSMGGITTAQAELFWRPRALWRNAGGMTQETSFALAKQATVL